MFDCSKVVIFSGGGLRKKVGVEAWELLDLKAF